MATSNRPAHVSQFRGVMSEAQHNKIIELTNDAIEAFTADQAPSGFNVAPYGPFNLEGNFSFRHTDVEVPISASFFPHTVMNITRQMGGAETVSSSLHVRQTNERQRELYREPETESGLSFRSELSKNMHSVELLGKLIIPIPIVGLHEETGYTFPSSYDLVSFSTVYPRTFSVAPIDQIKDNV